MTIDSALTKLTLSKNPNFAVLRKVGSRTMDLSRCLAAVDAESA